MATVRCTGEQDHPVNTAQRRVATTGQDSQGRDRDQTAQAVREETDRAARRDLPDPADQCRQGNACHRRAAVGAGVKA